RVHAGVLIEPAVFVGEQRFEVIGRYLIDRHRVTPHAVGIGETPQRRAVFSEHHPRQVILGQRQRPDPVREPEQQAEQQQAADEPARCTSRPLPSTLRQTAILWERACSRRRHISRPGIDLYASGNSPRPSTAKANSLYCVPPLSSGSRHAGRKRFRMAWPGNRGRDSLRGRRVKLVIQHVHSCRWQFRRRL
nr:hypothetical protein [Tanacetum cinerariifolium]